jgi:hypothetical protein
MENSNNLPNVNDLKKYKSSSLMSRLEARFGARKEDILFRQNRMGTTTSEFWIVYPEVDFEYLLRYHE